MNQARLGVATLLLAATAAASAQSNVTVYGKIDLGLRRAIGSSVNEIATGSDGRLGFRGVEDLGGGLAVVFGIEHRFFPDTGLQDGAQVWKGYSLVGLRGGFGSVTLGRQYIPAFSLVQNQVDPFGGDTVAQVRDVGMRVGGITKVRVDGSVRYDFSVGGFTVAASVAEAAKNGGPDRPVSLAASYRTGPLYVAVGHEDPAGARDRQWALATSYALGKSTLSAGYADGRTNAGIKARGFVLGVNWVVGAGELKAAYGKQDRNGTTFAQKVGLGYHHNLSKRTVIYTDVGHDTELAMRKTGFDLGIKHSF